MGNQYLLRMGMVLVLVMRFGNWTLVGKWWLHGAVIAAVAVVVAAAAVKMDRQCH